MDIFVDTATVYIVKLVVESEFQLVWKYMGLKMPRELLFMVGFSKAHFARLYT